MQNLLLGLAALACPIGMGVMMLLLGRQTRARDSPSNPVAARQVADLRSEIAQLKADRPVESRRG
jgi:hypothetical protein